MINFFLRDSTPPTSPQSHRNTERERERSTRVLGSPENRRVPQQQQFQNDHFEIVQYGGNDLDLSQGLAAQLRNLPPLPVNPAWGRSNTVNSMHAVSIYFCIVSLDFGPYPKIYKPQAQNAQAGPSNLQHNPVPQVGKIQFIFLLF